MGAIYRALYRHAINRVATLTPPTLYGRNSLRPLPPRDKSRGYSSTNSRIAIGAASPLRGPNLMIRVYPPGRSI